MGGFFFDFEAVWTASSDRDAPAQALQAPEVDVERAHFVGSPEEGQEEAQGPEAVGDLGVSILSVVLARRRRRRRGGRLHYSCSITKGRDLGGSLVVQTGFAASMLPAASHAFFCICRARRAYRTHTL